MNFLGNLLWIIFGGLISSIVWFLIGVCWCLTIIGIPIGLQCFKFSNFILLPFGKQILISNKTSHSILNVFWIIFSGIELAIYHFLIGLMLGISIIGIPFAIQQFKFIKLALFPFGAKIK